MKSGLYFCNQDAWERVYRGRNERIISKMLKCPDTVLTRDNWREHAGLLRDVEVIVSSWGGPIVDEEFLKLAPNLKLYLYGAGSIKGLMSDAAWERGVRITSAYAANAVPVAEFTLSQILFCLKNGWQLSRRAHDGASELWGVEKPVTGAFGAKVGIISLGMIGKEVCKLLQPFDVDVLVSSSYGSPELERELGVRFASVEEIFSTCDCISLHTPLLPSTRRMIKGGHFRSMKPGASFINTARGAVVREDEMIEVLRERPDLTAVLDVTDPEPPCPDSPLLSLANVVLTPHVAGAFGNECRRLGDYMLGELGLYLNHEPLRWEIKAEKAAALA